MLRLLSLLRRAGDRSGEPLDRRHRGPAAHYSSKGTDWYNRVAARSLLAIGAHRPGRKAANIRCPTLLIVAEIDTIAPIGPALRVADRAPKSQLYRSRGGHYGPYKGGEDHDNVMRVEVEFGLKRLVDLPMAWPDQWRALGLQAARRRKEMIRPSSLSSREGLIHPSEPGQVSRFESGARTGASSCLEQPPLPTLTGFEFIAEGVASRSRTNSLSSMLRETSPSAARKGAATTFIGASAASAQQPADRRERQSDGRNSEANPQEAHRSLHRPRDEDVPPTKTAGREDDRKASQGRPEKDRPRKPRDRRRAAGARLKCRADGVRS